MSIRIFSRILLNRRHVHDSLLKEKIFAYMDENVELPKLDYNYKDLEPIISEEIMRFHHLKHHQTYIDKYVDVMRFYNAEHSIHTFEQILRRANFNGGGHINHSIFWKSLVPPNEAHEPTEDLADLIKRDFVSFDNLRQNIKTISADLQGSGWVWLGYDMATHTLALTTTANQDILQMKTGLIPLLGIDLWEHAYYLQYKNDKMAYVENIMKILNWNHASNVLTYKQQRAKNIINTKL